MSRITASLALALAEAEGVLEREGVLVLVGAQALEGAPVREGRLCKHLLSQLRGGVLAPRYYDYRGRVIIWLNCCFYLTLFYFIWLSPPRRWQLCMNLAIA